MSIDGKIIREISGMPQDPNLGYPVWSPNGKKFAFTNTKQSSVELWICDLTSLSAKKIADSVNMVFENSFKWLADNNEGTFPIQSERFYAALKGFGATVRLVLLPNESHGYAARESILHKHWEVLNWMDKYVKAGK